MGLIIPPSLLPLQASKIGATQRSVVRFGYDFSTDTPVAQNLGGYAFTGSVWELDVSAIRNLYVVPNPFKSLQLTQTFLNFGTDVADGQLIVYVETTGQTIMLGVNPTIAGGDTTQAATVLTCIIPIVAAMPTKIMFGKEVALPAGVLHGKLRGTMFDFDLAPYVTQGICNNL